MLVLRNLIRFSGLTKMSIFTQNINPITGQTVWEEKDPDYDYYQEIARSSFADMLHDTERNQKYYQALKKAIDNKHKAGQEANVLDIGTGTGLLSMMAAKCGADSIVACEAFKPISESAKKIIKSNGFHDKIKVVYKRSTKLTVGEDGDLPKRANILVAEVFDTELIGEGAISTFSHAAEHLLEENSIVVPSRGTVWAQIVDSSIVHNWNRVKPLVNSKTNETLIVPPKLSVNCSGASCVHDVQLSQVPIDAFKPLINAHPVFKFDWTCKIPLQFNENIIFDLEPISSGEAHAVFFWWDLDMDTEGEIQLSCAPVWEHPDAKCDIESGEDAKKLAGQIPWRDHWMQAIYYFPQDCMVTMGKNIYLAASHDEYSFWFSLAHSPNNGIKDFERPKCDCYLHLSYPRNRIGQLNDDRRNQIYLQALNQHITSNSTILNLTDGSMLGLATSKMGAKKLYLLESNYLSRKATELFIKENHIENVEIIENNGDLPSDREIDLVFAEPYFVSSILPWDSLRYWYLISRYPKHIPKIPKGAIIKGVAMEFKDLQKIRAPLGNCEGFDLSIFDELIESSSRKTDSLVEAQPLWEYPGKALGEPFTIFNFDFHEDVYKLSPISVSKNIPFETNGSCNGIALWIDWVIHDDVIVSSGPNSKIVVGDEISWYYYTRQGVHLFPNAQKIGESSTLNISSKFNPLEGDMNFHFKILSNLS